MSPAALLLIAQASKIPVEALVYTTMSCTQAHRPEMAMDGDEKTSFRSRGAMEPGDDFTVILSRPIAATGLRVETGDASGDDLLADAAVLVSADGTTFVKAADFDAKGVADATLSGEVTAIRIKTSSRHAAPRLVVREIALRSATPIAHVQRGPGRAWSNLGAAPDLAGWAARAERQMESFWGPTEAILYADGFVAPNKVNVFYRSGPRVTGVAATGGGEMEVNVDYARKHPDDTGLTVHEVTHVVQAGGSPGWLVEAVADYVRWIEFEPQNFTYRLDPRNPDVRQPYRSGAVFLDWCELHYDSKLVTKLYAAARERRYSDALFQKYTGKDLATLGKEFFAAYAADPTHLLTPPTPSGTDARELPAVKEDTSVPVDLATLFTVTGVGADGKAVSETGGFDGEGSTYSGTLLGRTPTVRGVRFSVGAPGVPNVVVAKGQTVALGGTHASLWLLASGIEGGQLAQRVAVTYADGTTQSFIQNFSDWYEPEGFPGEARAVRMARRNLASGESDPRTFYVYAYGFPLDAAKALKSVTLPNDENVRVLAISTAD